MSRMALSRHYSRSPIVEAIIDLTVELPEAVVSSDLERCHDPAYPSKKVLAVPQLEEEGSPTATSPQRGFEFSSADEKQLYVVHLNGFAMHRLAPYQGWEPFRDEARRLWNIYRQTARPRKVDRVAARYINRLDLPGPTVELKDYLKTSPEVSPGLLQPLAAFFMQLRFPQPDIRGTLLLREAAVESTTSVVLDIDLFRTEELPPDEASMWRLLQDLHQRINEVFEACLTDKTRELIR